MIAAGSTAGGGPVARTSLVGRAHDVASISELLRRGGARVLTVTGPGGAGKTRVALRVSEELSPHFPEGVVFVGLDSVRDAAHVVPAVARAFGLREAGKRSLARRLADLLRDRRLLVVLDNFEHVLDAAPAVAELVAGSTGPSVLVTSRAPLRVSGEQEYPLPPLHVPEAGASPAEVVEAAAVRLFAERAHSVDPAFLLSRDNAGAVADICRRLDGLPLALELAAAKTRVLPPEALLARLERRLPVLTGGTRDQPVRLRTMRAAIAWTYDLLTPTEQKLFRQLAVHVGGFDLEAAAAVAGMDAGDGDVFTGVDALAEHSLVRPLESVAGVPRFGLLETIREFGLERLDAASEGEQVRRAHALRYLAVAEGIEAELLGRRPDAALARLSAEHGNLTAALELFESVGDEVALGRLAGALREYWYATGRWGEGRRWLDRSRRADLPEEVAAKVHVAAGFLAHYQGDDANALPLLERGLELMRQVGDEREEAYARYLLGVAAEDRGDYGAARQLLGEAAGRLESLGDGTNAAYAQAHLGIVALGSGDPREAAALGEAARALAAEEGGAGPEAVAVLLLGDAACEAGDLAEAAERYREHLELIRASADQASEDLARATASVAVLASRRGQVRRAARLLGAAERLRETVGLALALPELLACERATAQARDGLGELAFHAATQEGRALTPEEAHAEVEHALGLRAADAGEPAPAGLSPRELEVLRLIAAGKTNREIAETLFLSVRTVERHVTNLYGKIGGRGRADATAFALRHRLA